MLTLLEGDCLALLPTLPAGSVDLVCADLPYGTTACKWDCPLPLDVLWREYKRVLRPKGAVVLFGAQPFTSALVMSNPAWFRYTWVWVKSKVTGYLNAKRQPLRKVEDVCVFYARQGTYNPQMRVVKHRFVSRSGGYSRAGRGYGTHAAISSDNGGVSYPSNVLEIPCEHTELHPTQKPLALLEYLVLTYTNPGMTVLDNTMGSGTTGEACVITGRDFVGMELDAHYFAVAQTRIEQAVARQAGAPLLAPPRLTAAQPALL